MAVFAWNSIPDEEDPSRSQCKQFNWWGHTTPDLLQGYRDALHPTERALLELLEHRAIRAFHSDVKFSIERLASQLGITRQHVTRTYKRLAQMGFIGVCRRAFSTKTDGGKKFTSVVMFRVHSIGYRFQWQFQEHPARFKRDIRPRFKKFKPKPHQDVVRIESRIGPEWFITEPLDRFDSATGQIQKIQPKLGSWPQMYELKQRWVTPEFLRDHDTLKDAYESNHPQAMAIFGKPIMHEDVQDYDYDSRR